MNVNFRKWKTEFSNIEKTNWGLTNDNYLLDQKYVLRKATLNNNFTDHEQEIAILKLLKYQQITAPVLDFWVEKNDYFIVTKYIPNQIPLKILKSDELKRIGRLIKAFQKIPANDKTIKKINLKDNLTTHLNLYQQKYPKIIIDALKALNNFLETWKTNEWTLSHNDLVLENLILTPEKEDYLIDFEYASLNSKLYDPACLIAESQLWKQSQLCQQWLKIFKISDKSEKNIWYLVIYRLIIGYLWSGYYYQKTNDVLYKELHLRKKNEISDVWRLKIDYFMKTM